MKQDIKTDAQFQAMTSQFQVTEPQMFCSSQKRLFLICINPKCQKPSLVCNDWSCGPCHKTSHVSCSYSTLPGMTHQLNERSTIQKQFLYKVWSIQNEVIELISHSRKRVADKYYLGGLSQEDLKVVDQIYKNKNSNYLKGKQAKAFCQRLERENEWLLSKGDIFIEQFKGSIKKLVDDIVVLIERFYQSFVSLKQFKPNQNFTVDSENSLIAQLNAQQRLFLSKSLNYPTKFQLLYRGSQQGFSVSRFHLKCDNIKNTLTIVRTQYGKTIGGFTEYPWKSSGGYYGQAGKNAFLLSFDLKEKMVPKDGNKLIYYHSSYGPTFGNHQDDLHIRDSCNNNRSSSANFPEQYNREGENKYVKSQETTKLFCGATDGNSFRVLEYEVFRVVY